MGPADPWLLFQMFSNGCQWVTALGHRKKWIRMGEQATCGCFDGCIKSEYIFRIPNIDIQNMAKTDSQRLGTRLWIIVSHKKLTVLRCTITDSQITMHSPSSMLILFEPFMRKM